MNIHLKAWLWLALALTFFSQSFVHANQWEVVSKFPLSGQQYAEISPEHLKYLRGYLQKHSLPKSLTKPPLKKSTVLYTIDLLTRQLEQGKLYKQKILNAFHCLKLSQNNKVFLTGYYTPVFGGSLKASDKYKYPLYTSPKNNKLKSLTRTQIDRDGSLKKKTLELVYLKSKLDAYLIHVQGSATITLTNGQFLKVAFDSSNNLSYTSLGKLLIKDGHVPEKEMSLGVIRKFFKQYPDKLDHYLWQNQRYIFFKSSAIEPTGSVGAKVVSLGSLASEKFSNGTYRYPPLMPTLILFPQGNRLNNIIAFHQDTGSAIKGINRFDLYTGIGHRAEQIAGPLKDDFPFFMLWPKRIPLPDSIAGLPVVSSKKINQALNKK